MMEGQKMSSSTQHVDHAGERYNQQGASIEEVSQITLKPYDPE